MTVLGTITNGLAAVRHTVALLALGIAGVASLTLLYSEVAATSDEVRDNSERIEHLEEAYQSIKTQQHVIIEQIENEKGNNKEFRDRTDRSLERILERLPVSPHYERR